MSFVCCLPIAECVYCLGLARWARNKFCYTAGRESETWGLATASEFEPVPRVCRYILSVYEDDLRNPLWAPRGGYGVDLDCVVAKRTYDDTRGKVAPYMIYLDHKNEEIILAFRGLDLAKESDYLVLLDDKLGQAKFDGGFVHNGLLKSAQWVIDKDSNLLGELIVGHPNYTLMLAGHSLGAGVATMLAMLAVKNNERFGNIDRRMIKCFSVAPTSSADIPPIVKTCIQVDGRFERIVVSCNMMTDHAMICILTEAEKTLDAMLERDDAMSIPKQQRMKQ